MPPYKPIKFSIVKSKLEKLGFSIISQKGSHVKFAKATEEGIITTIVPKHREVSSGTIKSIIKQAMLTSDEFDEA
ncbi:type II toxin-antitoxin system HicA family toxin [Bacteroidota bacterium]